MEKSKEVIFCKQLFLILGREKKTELLQKSNLTDRERRLFELRFVQGKTTQETADELNVAIDTFNKMQKKAFQKLYLWLSLHFENQT
jgi:DNA-directed RNA polymerase specialized sigma24 family protein